MAYHSQTCDPFFERVDDRGRICREDARKVERHVKRQRQLTIAAELSHLATEEYSEDILRQMETMEVKRLIRDHTMTRVLTYQAACHLTGCCIY